jgi:hypothetical protein
MVALAIQTWLQPVFLPKLPSFFTNYVKFIHSEKATKFCEISTTDLSYVVMVQPMVGISQNFVAFSEYMNFKVKCRNKVMNPDFPNGSHSQ